MLSFPPSSILPSPFPSLPFLPIHQSTLSLNIYSSLYFLFPLKFKLPSTKKQDLNLVIIHALELQWNNFLQLQHLLSSTNILQDSSTHLPTADQASQLGTTPLVLEDHTLPWHSTSCQEDKNTGFSYYTYLSNKYVQQLLSANHYLNYSKIELQTK